MTQYCGYLCEMGTTPSETTVDVGYEDFAMSLARHDDVCRWCIESAGIPAEAPDRTGVLEHNEA
jgi:hypothetical protein